MQEQLKKELQTVALKITKWDNTSTVLELKNTAKALYEKLTVLEFVTSNLNNNVKQEVIIEEKPVIKPTVVIQKEEVKTPVFETTPTIQEVKKEIKSQEIVEKVEEPKVVFETPVVKTETVEKPKETAPQEIKTSKPASNDLNSFLSNDDVETIFDKSQWTAKEAEKPSLNQQLIPETIVVGLNDRIAFVNNLFNYSQADFNRVLSQLNTIENEQEAYDFINKRVKPEYNWEGKEEYETRLLALIARRFSN